MEDKKLTLLFEILLLLLLVLSCMIHIQIQSRFDFSQSKNNLTLIKFRTLFCYSLCFTSFYVPRFHFFLIWLRNHISLRKKRLRLSTFNLSWFLKCNEKLRQNLRLLRKVQFEFVHFQGSSRSLALYWLQFSLIFDRAL